jgi:hypothetical protein
MQLTHAGVDSLYKGPWEGPLFFAFDSLHWQPIEPSHVLVTGVFEWLPPESPDTGKYIYLSVLERTATGLRILVEHETIEPPHPQWIQRVLGKQRDTAASGWGQHAAESESS